MKDFTEYFKGISPYKSNLEDTFFSFKQCLFLLEQAYNDGLNDANKSKSKIDDSLINEFEQFRKAYKGTKRGLKTEYDNLVKKHKDYKEIVPKLLGLYEIQEIRRNAMKDRGDWIPQLPNMQTYINQRRWEECENTMQLATDTNARHFDDQTLGSKVYTMNGHKYYGNGIEIPMIAPKRPSCQHIYNTSNNTWYID